MFRTIGKRAVSLLIAFAVILTAFTGLKAAEITAFADSDTSSDPVTASGTCGDNLTWTLENGTLTISGSGEMSNYFSNNSPWLSYRDSITNVIILDNITSIGNCAFDECSSLTSIVIPDSVTSIGEHAFYGCSSLTSITIPDGVTSIGDYAFIACTSLTSIEIPDDVTSIGSWAFEGCSSLSSIVVNENNNNYKSVDGVLFNKNITKLICYPAGKTDTSYTIPDSVTSIVWHAFYGCSSLTSIVIPDRVTSIGYSAFYQCTSLTSIVIPDSVTFIGYDAFEDCSSLSSIVVNENNNNYKSVDGVLFNKNITKLICYPAGKTNTLYTIPDSVTYIEEKAFYNCSSLTSIVIPDRVTSIEMHAFYGCSSLTSIEIPDGVTSIGSWAFYGCSSLTSIEIPDSVTSIGLSAFYGCSSLTSIEIPDSVTSIGYCAFYGCSSLTSIEIPDSVTSIEWYAFYGCSSLTSIEIPDGVTSIGWYTFDGCSSLTSIEIPDSVTSIGYRAFYGCSSLTSIVIPDSVTSIERYAFYGCSSLTSIEIPDSVTSIEEYAFYGCSSLTNIEIPDSVTSIGNSAFARCKSLTNITIPDSVTSIGNSAFELCSSLTSIEIPDGVTAIGDYAFIACTSLTSIVIPDSVTSIGKYAFAFCTSLKSIEIPDSVTSMGSNAFYRCLSLTSIKIPSSVTSIGERAFICCSSLTNIVVDENNNNYKSVDGVLFNKDITELICYPAGKTDTSYTIPDSVISIGECAFAECSSLTSIVIPDSVTSIGDYAFDYCTNLNTIYLPKDAEIEIGNKAIPEWTTIVYYSSLDEIPTSPDDDSTGNKTDDGDTNDDPSITTSAENLFTIKVTTAGNGTATASAEDAESGTVITLTATPDSGYRFSKWQVVSGDITISDNRFTLGESDVEINAVFTRKTTATRRPSSNSTATSDATTDTVTVNGISGSWTTVTDTISESANGGIVTISGKTEIPAVVVSAAAAKLITLEVKINDTYTWVIDPVKVGSGSLDLSVTTATITTASPNTITGSELKNLDLTVNADNLGIGASLRVATGKTNSGKFANLFKVENGELVFVDVVKIDSAGNALLPDMDLGVYRIVVDDETKLVGDLDNSMGITALDAAAMLKAIVNATSGIASDAVPKFDYNGDGRADALDAASVLQWVVNK